ncbi:MAG: hypothetical protein R2750_02795 [Bacteroidales bacterium]
MSEKYKHIDDLFRNKFEHFEVDPPAYVWENVKLELAKSSSNSGIGEKGFTGLSFTIFILGLLSFLLLNHDDPVRSKSAIDKISNSEFVSNTRSFDLIADNVIDKNSTHTVRLTNDDAFDNENPDEDEISSKKSKRTKKQKATKSLITIEPVLDNPIKPDVIGKTDLRADKTGMKENVVQNPFNNNAAALPFNYLTTVEKNHSQERKINSRHQYENSKKRSNVGFKSDYGKKGLWSAGIYFTPELIKYNADNSFDNRSYSIEILTQRTKNNFLFQTGLGISKVTDKGNYQIDYNKYLGSYEDVYNVTFDTIQGEIIPVYHTETVDVFDTIYKTVISPTKRIFTYLNIPLMVGYSHESNHFTWFVKAGPSLSVMVSENMSEVAMPGPENKIILSENELPQRIKTNWQFTISAGTSMKLNNYLSISIEPLFRYYIKSAYEPNSLSTKHPYSIGLRTGFLLDF